MTTPRDAQEAPDDPMIAARAQLAVLKAAGRAADEMTRDKVLVAILDRIAWTVDRSGVSPEMAMLLTISSHPYMFRFLGADVPAERYRASGETGIDG